MNFSQGYYTELSNLKRKNLLFQLGSEYLLEFQTKFKFFQLLFDSSGTMVASYIQYRFHFCVDIHKSLLESHLDSSENSFPFRNSSIDILQK